MLQGQATDIAIQAEEIVKLKKMLNELMSQHTGQPVDLIGQCTNMCKFTPQMGALDFSCMVKCNGYITYVLL